MATFGLQNDFLDKVLKEYFGLSTPDLNGNDIYVGLGLTQHGNSTNTTDFVEVFGGKPLGNYKRARIIFNRASDGYTTNANEVVFNTASEDWTTDTDKVEMVGLFNTKEYEDEEGNTIKPWVVLKLEESTSVLTGETLVVSKNSLRLNLSDL